MAKIKCPKCGEVFTVDEKEYADILVQIKNEEFNLLVNLYNNVFYGRIKFTLESRRFLFFFH